MNCQKFAPVLYLTSLYLARIGRPDILWSVNKLARSVTKWTQACDRRLARLISYIHYTSDYRQYCRVGTAAQHCPWDSKSTSGGVLCIFGSRLLVPISWMCKKQTSVYHSSTESEIISLDAGLRMDGLLALDLWDLVIEVPRTTPKITKTNPSEHTGNRCTNPKHTQGSECESIERRSSFFERTSLWEGITVVHLWVKRSCGQNDHQRAKSNDEKCIPQPPSCSGLVVWQIQVGTQDLNQIRWH